MTRFVAVSVLRPACPAGRQAHRSISRPSENSQPEVLRTHDFIHAPAMPPPKLSTGRLPNEAATANSRGTAGSLPVVEGFGGGIAGAWMKSWVLRTSGWLFSLGLLMLLCACRPAGQAGRNTETATNRVIRAKLEKLRAKAQSGDPQTQFDLGLMLARGHGVPQDHSEAAGWFRKAAERGHPRSQATLGAMFANGEGVQQNVAEAIGWYRRAAEQGNTDAQANLGTVYAQGHGVPKDYAEAIRWLRKAAEKGDAYSQAYLGSLCARGLGVKQDLAEALAWYRKAADRIIRKANFILASPGKMEKPRRKTKPKQ